MKKYEYRLEYLKFVLEKENEDQLLEALNKFGSEGWRLNRFYGGLSLRAPFSWKGGINLVLEREIEAS